MSGALYGMKPSVVFEASVHILRGNIPAAKDIVSGKLQDFPGVEELLGTSTDSQDNAVLSWIDGKNNFVPPNIDHFFERAFLQINLTSPEKLIFLGFLEQANIKNHHGYCEDFPSEHYEKLLKTSNDYLLSALQENKWKNVTSVQELSRRILKWRIEHSNRDMRDHIYSITQVTGYHNRFTILNTQFAIIENSSDVERYINRLEKFKTKFNLIAEDIRKKRDIGVMAPKVCLQKICRALQGLISKLKVENNSLVLTVRGKYKNATKEDLPKEMIEKILTNIQEYVIPGLGNVLDEVKTCIDHTPDTDPPGIWRLPRGEELYKHYLKWFTSTDYTPEQVHQIGLDNIKTLHEGVQTVVKQLNEKGDMTLSVDNSPEENLRILAEDERFLYEDTLAGREKCIKEFERLLDEITAKVKNMFNVVPSNRCIIKPMPKAMGEVGAAGFYLEGSLDLTRPGMFFANVTNIKRQNKSGMKALTAHEAVPGHHYQCSIERENFKLPYFRRCRGSGFFTAFSEGWGLYAEHLGRETGFYSEEDGSDGYSVLGYYCYELLRSTRLVVDTGLHAFRWTREQAIDLMMKNTGLDRKIAEEEIDRYSAIPGQACAYKIGQLKLLEIRKKLEERPDFDIKQFHDTILDIGAVPLDILEEFML